VLNAALSIRWRITLATAGRSAGTATCILGGRRRLPRSDSGASMESTRRSEATGCRSPEKKTAFDCRGEPYRWRRSTRMAITSSNGVEGRHDGVGDQAGQRARHRGQSAVINSHQIVPGVKPAGITMTFPMTPSVNAISESPCSRSVSTSSASTVGGNPSSRPRAQRASRPDRPRGSNVAGGGYRRMLRRPWSFTDRSQ